MKVKLSAGTPNWSISVPYMTQTDVDACFTSSTNSVIRADGRVVRINNSFIDGDVTHIKPPFVEWSLSKGRVVLVVCAANSGEDFGGTIVNDTGVPLAIYDTFIDNWTVSGVHGIAGLKRVIEPDEYIHYSIYAQDDDGESQPDTFSVYISPLIPSAKYELV